MMGGRRLRAAFRLVNRGPRVPEAQWRRLPLFEAAEWTALLGGEGLAGLTRSPALEEAFGNVAAQVFVGKTSGLALYFIARADYVPQLRALELTCLDPQGALRRYVPLADLVPVTYHDLDARFAFRSRFIDEAEAEMVYKHGRCEEFYLFLRGGRWDPAAANHPDLDFRRNFDEAGWFEAQQFAE